jgi:hypothetical protein
MGILPSSVCAYAHFDRPLCVELVVFFFATPPHDIDIQQLLASIYNSTNPSEREREHQAPALEAFHGHRTQIGQNGEKVVAERERTRKVDEITNELTSDSINHIAYILLNILDSNSFHMSRGQKRE